jgi:hypothetical protein
MINDGHPAAIIRVIRQRVLAVLCISVCCPCTAFIILQYNARGSELGVVEKAFYSVLGLQAWHIIKARKEAQDDRL